MASKKNMGIKKTAVLSPVNNGGAMPKRNSILNRGSDDELPRQNVGAASPYALAGIVQRLDSKLGSTITINTQTAVNLKNFNSILLKPAHSQLFSIFRLKYEKLFDPKWGSPLYAQAVIDIARGKSSGSTTQRAPPGYSSEPDHWGTPSPVIFNMTTPFYRRMDDPIQAGIPNCYLIAALSSLACCEKSMSGNSFPPTNLAGSDLSITLYDENTKSQWQKNVTSELQLSVYNNPAFAQLSPQTVYQSGGETWPGIYEKAFAYMKGFPYPDIIRSDRFNPNADPTIKLPDDYTDINYYWNFNGGGYNPLSALVNLTGKTATTFLTKDNTATQTFVDIKNHCTGTSGTPVGAAGASLRANDPMVAWTYLTADFAPDPKPTYQDEVIPANHSFSILGVWYKTIGTPKGNFIVLRNPWGRLLGVASDPDPSKATDSDIQPVSGSWYTGTWGPTTVSLSMSYSDGIFALRDTAFKKYFEAYGWVL